MRALISRGLAQYGRHDYDGAIADFSAVIALDPANVGALRNRALAYGAKGDYDREINDSAAAKRLEGAAR